MAPPVFRICEPGFEGSAATGPFLRTVTFGFRGSSAKGNPESLHPLSLGYRVEGLGCSMWGLGSRV